MVCLVADPAYVQIRPAAPIGPAGFLFSAGDPDLETKVLKS
jgi:hypothetical protein